MPLPAMMPYCMGGGPTLGAVQPCAGWEAGVTHGQPMTWHTVVQAGKAKLALGTCKDMAVCCERMELCASDGGSVTLAAHGSQIAVACKCVEALADSVSKTDHGVILRGHVRLCNQSKEWMHCSCPMEQAEICWKNGEMQFHCTWSKGNSCPEAHSVTPVQHVEEEKE
jgi:hypothetical protein